MRSPFLMALIVIFPLAACQNATPESRKDPATAVATERAQEAPKAGAAPDVAAAKVSPDAAQAAKVDEAAPADGAEAAPDETVKAAEVAPEAAPEVAEVLTSPDGTVILPCGTAPEGMVCIPGGPFIRGSDNDPHSECKQPSYNKRHATNNSPASTIWMQTYYIDKTEVTFGAYSACMEAGECNKAKPLYRDFDRPLQPMTGMSWTDSDKFCTAQGKHLVTEAQWEKAARGPDGLLYPWGNEPEANCDIAVIMNEQGQRSCGIEKIGYKPEKGRVLEVCSRAEGVYGLCDMVGNAEEWVADWYSHSFADCGADCEGMDPLGPCGGKEEGCKHRYKVVRGGSWYWPKEHATSIHRRSHVPSNDPYHHYGFRCAASLDEAQAIAGEPAAVEAPSAPVQVIAP
ncbi:MAG: hypothetical protein AUK47_20460 [Deltaproteobacteria bacterium CG2_30_63_29]|nr:MAG: hypothetical protein AUK47_20460 [Deltaproteobacteria bacterium CG2_30_63_29]PJB43674.1 MAG: hypothetical protein CO108_09775 [Deltaproteobacteria bacterium CG_4_9_14_3_um_filter_63_12]